MTPVNLVLSLREELTRELENYRYEADGGDRKHVGVYLQLSDENFIDEAKYPLVMIDIQKIIDAPTDDQAEVEITIGTFGEDDLAVIDLLNITERVRRYLLNNRIIGRKFPIRHPLEIQFVTDQTYPFRFAYIKARYVIAS